MYFTKVMWYNIYRSEKRPTNLILECSEEQSYLS